MQKRQEITLEGCAVSNGIAIGMPFVLEAIESVIPEINLESKDVHNEIARYRNALQNSRADLLRIKNELIREGVQDGVLVLEAHLQMIDDPLLSSTIEEEIKQTKKNAEFVFQRAIQRVKKKFESLADPFFKQRFEDIHDISKRILAYLREMKRLSLTDVPQNSIVFTYSLSPSDAAEAQKQRIGAFVTQVGGGTSHTAIVAKAKGIPYVASVNFKKILSLSKTSMCIVDGITGKIILNPSEKTLIHYRQLKMLMQKQHQFLKSAISLPSETSDGMTVKLFANVEIGDNFDEILEHGADGIGLFRSEFIVLQRGIFPTEDEQYTIYKELVLSMKNAPVIIRAFDIGFDKVACGLDGNVELNPALGLRAIRFLLQEKELLKVQLRAILRAAHYGEVKILLPMISGVGELLEAKIILQEAINELKKEGIRFGKKVPLGCMIEVPSAALTVDLIAQECDFLSIGTNDLTQYTLAVDRMNQKACATYSSTHPSVVRLMKFIVDEASKYNVPVSVCGEIASDPCLIPLLIGLGLKQLSVSSRFLPIIRHVVRSTSQKEAQELVKQVLALKTSHDIYSLLTREYEKNIPYGSLASIKE